ncbi:MAG: hypothetical protein HC835_10895 [Oscillatoriales cyanobacterium RM2_1_1]|nr:hypothetical protein [Oscillatoriales cyanobacterium SM2_3_0]NJO46085.1 hypothetical protein [Oscillatoriales cyanobacterium RM2_1_1]
MALISSGQLHLNPNATVTLAWNLPYRTAATLVPIPTGGGANNITQRIQWDQLEVRHIAAGEPGLSDNITQYRIRAHNVTPNIGFYYRLAINTFGVI